MGAQLGMIIHVKWEHDVYRNGGMLWRRAVIRGRICVRITRKEY